MFANPANQSRFLRSVAVSRFGDGMSDIAIFTLAFSLNSSPQLVMIIAALKIFAAFCASFVTPLLLQKSIERISLYRTLDLIRAGLITSALFSPNIYVLFVICVPIFVAEAIAGALSASVLQNLCTSDNRVQLNGRFQYVSFGFDMAGRAAAALLILFIPLKVLFVLDGMTFLASAAVLLFMSKLFIPSVSSKPLQIYAFVLKDPVQRNIVLLRLAGLTTLSIFSLFAAYRITELANGLQLAGLLSPLADLGQQQIFSLLNGIFTICISAATVLGARFIGQNVNPQNLPSYSLAGLGLLIISMWTLAGSFISLTGFALYCLGGAACSLGTVILRLNILTTGQYLTPHTILAQVIATSDSFARLWQNGVTGIALLVSATLNPVVVIASAAILTAAGAFPSLQLGRQLLAQLNSEKGTNYENKSEGKTGF